MPFELYLKKNSKIGCLIENNLKFRFMVKNKKGKVSVSYYYIHLNVWNIIYMCDVLY